MKNLLFIMLLFSSNIISQTSTSVTFDAVKKEYGINFRHNEIIFSAKNGKYNSKLEHVSVLEFGIGYAYNLEEYSTLYIIPTYNIYHNKSDDFIFFNENKFRTLSFELGCEINLSAHLITNLFFDPLMGEARVGIGYQF